MTHAAHHGSQVGLSSTWARAAKLTAWAAVLAPLGVLLHELGHWVAAQALGYSGAALLTASVSGGAKLGEAPGWMVAVEALGGPAVTVVLIMIALQALRRSQPPLWAIALGATAPLRFLVVGVHLVVKIGMLAMGQQLGTPNFDEYNAAAGLGWPPEPLYAAVLALLIYAWVKVVRHALRGWRWIGLLALVAGSAVGLALWMNVVGPLLFGG